MMPGPGRSTDPRAAIMWTAAHGCWGAADGMADTRPNVTARVMRARKFLESIVEPKAKIFVRPWP